MPVTNIFGAASFLSVAAYFVKTESCEFECNYAADGCITMEKVYDGEINCFRDGSDENEDARDLVLSLLFPQGKFSSFSNSFQSLPFLFCAHIVF